MSDFHYNHKQDMLSDVSEQDRIDQAISSVDRYTELKPPEEPPEERF